MTIHNERDPFDELPILSEIGGELDRILAATEHETALRRAWRTLARWRGPRLFALAGAVAVIGTGTALAASGVLFGSPVKPIGPLVATAGVGVPLPGGSRLLSLRVPDPAGGLPWGMRVVRTTRSQLCIQIGRVEDNKLGELGIDGNFGNDGRFHPLPPDAFSTTCGTPGATYSDLYTGVDASAAGRLSLRPASAGDRRIISFGLLGANAQSLTYTTDGTARTLTPLAGLGAYLIVQPDTASVARADGACAACVSEQGGTNGAGALRYPQTDPANPDGAVKSITYHLGGRTCVDNLWNGLAPGNVNELDKLSEQFRRSCGLSMGPPPQGPALPNLRAPLTAHLQTRGHVITNAEVAFRSPIAITKADQQYTAEARLGSSNFGYQFAGITGTDQNIARGAIVTIPIERLLASAASRTVTIEVDYVDNLPGYPNEHATVGTITIHKPAGTHPAPLPSRHPLPKIQQRTTLLGLSVPDPAGGPPWGGELLLRQVPSFAAQPRLRVSVNVEFGRRVNDKLGLLGVAGAYSNDHRLHAPDSANLLAGFWGANTSGSYSQPNLASMNHWDYTIPSTINAEHYCALCTNAQLRTLVAGYAGTGATTVTLTGQGLHQTERLSRDDHGIYLFVLTGRWNRQTRYTITANCSSGKLSSGPAGSRGDTGKPFCPA